MKQTLQKSKFSMIKLTLFKIKKLPSWFTLCRLSRLHQDLIWTSYKVFRTPSYGSSFIFSWKMSRSINWIIYWRIWTASTVKIFGITKNNTLKLWDITNWKLITLRFSVDKTLSFELFISTTWKSRFLHKLTFLIMVASNK